MAKLEWDKTGERVWEAGVENGVFYPQIADGSYPTGVAWNGLVSVNETPNGGEPNYFYADNIRYGGIAGVENFDGAIEAMTYPDEVAEANGEGELSTGVRMGAQGRSRFGLAYKTKIGNDVEGQDLGYKLHLVYGAQFNPSEKAYETINDSPDAVTFSWDFTTLPIPVTDHKPTAILTLDSRTVEAADLQAIEDQLFGTDVITANLPTPDEILAIINA